MGKRVRNSLEQSQQDKRDHDLEDRIGWLPDELLVFILSFLTLREAAITSVLSTRWRYLWACISRLDFDASKTLDKIILVPKLLKVERPRFINSVNRVIKLHKGLPLEEFRVHFDLDKHSKSAIHKWLTFALSEKIQSLELDLSEKGYRTRPSSKSYTFPKSMFLKSKRPSLQQSSSSICGICPRAFVGFKSLNVLCLRCVNVTEEVFGYFLSHFPVLERLVMDGMEGLVNLKVVGPSLMLKYLELLSCFGIKTIEISDTNLVSFKYSGGTKSLLLKNVPQLVEVSVDGYICKSFDYLFGQLSCCLSQLETLTLGGFPDEEMERFHVLHKLTSLKQLVLRFLITHDERSLLPLTSLIGACPHLQRFALQLQWYSPSRTRGNVMKVVTSPLQCLKVVEFGGYYGRASDLEFAMYIIKNAVTLERIIIDPRSQLLVRNVKQRPSSPKEIIEQQAARLRAKHQLEGNVPPGVELVIL